MTDLFDRLRQHAMTTALSAASGLILIKFFLPSFFDFVTDLLVLAILYGVGKVRQ